MIEVKQLYIDFDGVILDTISYPYELMAKKGITPDNTSEVSKFYAELDWKSFLKKVPVIHNSIDCIQKIIDSKQFNISILTHVTTLDEAIEKVKYLRRYFKDITIIPVPRKISKTKMVHTEGAILIDDFTDNLREWTSEGGIGVRFSTKLSGKGYPVLDYLDKIIDMNCEDYRN